MLKKIAGIVSVVSLVSGTVQASGFGEFYKKFGDLDVNKGYHKTNKKIKKRAKKLGYYASVQEVKDALAGKKIDGKPVVIVDSRTKKEQAGLALKGVQYANLRGWNKTFSDKRLHSDKIGAIYNYCRTGTDVAGSLVNLEWLFQGKGKIFGLKDMVVSCYPVISKSGKVLDAKLNAKHTYVQKADNGFYYEANCKEVQNSCAPIDVFTETDIELANDDNEKLPATFIIKNKKLKKEITVYLGKDNRYYKKGCKRP